MVSPPLLQRSRGALVATTSQLGVLLHVHKTQRSPQITAISPQRQPSSNGAIIQSVLTAMHLSATQTPAKLHSTSSHVLAKPSRPHTHACRVNATSVVLHTREGVFHKRLTLMRRQTQPATHNMLAMTPHNPPLTNVTIDVTTDPQTNGATVNQ